jgi:hypothetical protein
VRYREDTPELLARARAAVAAWRDRNPAGTSEELVAAIGHQFHRDYGVVRAARRFSAAVGGTNDARLQGTITALAALLAVENEQSVQRAILYAALSAQPPGPSRRVDWLRHCLFPRSAGCG